MTEEIELSFPLNQALLDEASKIKNERRLIKERINKIEAKKKEVTPSVYQKVKQDYLAKLNETSNALLEKKTDIDKELSSLYETRSRVNEEFEHNKEALEEMKFRNTLGEYPEDEFEKLENEAFDKITKLEKIIKSLNSNIERYESIFSDEDDIVENTEPSIRKQRPKAEKLPAPPKEESDYMLPAEEVDEDYFAPGKDETPIQEPIHFEEHSGSSDVTKKTFTSGEARIIIIEGEQAGQEYKLKKENTIGRANTNMVSLKDAKVSRQHAVIKKTGNEFSIMDLNSSNGIYVNHERVKEHVLGDGDQFQIGDHVFQFKLLS